MNGINAAVIAACGAAIVCAILSNFVTDSGHKRILSLVLGAFLVCSMIAPVKNAVESISLQSAGSADSEQLSATADEAMKRQVVAQARKNLQNTLSAIMLQNGIEVSRSEIILAEDSSGGIIISRLCIYIDESQSAEIQRIKEISEEHFGILPEISVEQA